MARDFVPFRTLTDNTAIALIMPGFYQNTQLSPSALLAAYTQERLLMRLDAGTNTATMEIGVTAGSGLSEEITVNSTISFAYGSRQYFDITDVLRSVFDKSIRSAITDTGTRGVISVETYDANGNVLAKAEEFSFMYYDATNMNTPVLSYQVPTATWLLPDTFRMPYGATGAILPQGCVRMTRGSLVLEILDSANVTIDSITSTPVCHSTFGWGFNPADDAAFVRLKGASLIEEARVIWKKCDKQSLYLTWWSPVSGGWKSVLADIVKTADNITESEAYIKGFDNAEGKAGNLGWNVRIPNCTLRDYEYYRDIYYSGDVFVWDMFVFDQNGQVYDPYMRPVRVGGAPPARPLVGNVDLDLNVVMTEASSIW